MKREREDVGIVKVSIDLQLTLHDARVLRSWASVGRFHDAIKRLCKEIVSGETISANLEQDSIALEQDSITLKLPLSSLHYQIRAKLVEMGIEPLWDQNQK